MSREAGFFFLLWVLGKVPFEALLHSGKACGPLHNCSVMGKLCGVGAIMLSGKMFTVSHPCVAQF